MKIIIPCDSQQNIGGGFLFRQNLKKGLEGLGHEVVDDMLGADVALVAGVTMVTWGTVEAIKKQGLKLIVRLDNVPRNSRNRNTGTSRLKGFCGMADEVVWQCEWARSYLIDFIGREGKVIYNGVDTEIFNEGTIGEGRIFVEGDYIDFHCPREKVYLYSRYNRDETKNWEVAWYKFQLLFREDKERKLVLVGQFSPEQIEYRFDFFRGEKVEYLGVVEDRNKMARVYRGAGYLLATYFNDCYSNTYLESMACGCKLFEPDMSGGTPELIKNGVIPLEKMAKEYEKLFMEVLNK